jgi:hypothetical protein
MSGFPTLAGIVTIVLIPWRCTQVATVWRDPDPPTTMARTTRPDEATTTRVSPGTAGDPPAKPSVQLADEVVLRALDERQASFMRCFERAQKLDGIGRTDVVLHLEVDALGVVHTATNDAIDDRLRTCVNAVALHLVFSEPGQPVVLDVPMLFR